MREIPPEERDFEYYKAIITKYYNPTCETFSPEEYDYLKKEIESGNENAKKELLRKTFLTALDQIADMFAKGQLTGSFEDCLQDAWDIVYRRKNILKLVLSIDYLSSFAGRIKMQIKSTLQAKAISQKRRNLDLNFEKVESLHNIEQEIPDKDSDEKAYTILEGKNLTHDINKTLKTIKGREAKVLKMKCGLDNEFKEPKSNGEIGKKYGVSRQYIDNLSAKGLRELRRPSKSKVLKEYN